MANFISKNIMLNWDGEDIKINITNELCNDIESNGCSLMQLSTEVATKLRTPPVYLISQFVSMVLRFNGKPVTQDDILNIIPKDSGKTVDLAYFCLNFVAKAFNYTDEAEETAGKPKKAKAK